MLQTNVAINGRYRILHTLGVGGMGTVYAAHDERLGRQVALKLLRSDLAMDRRSRERFIREAQIAAQLIHPNIVRTYDVGEAPEGPYLVQELLAGRTLDAEMPLSPAQTVQIALGVVEALDYIHGQGYVHCDIKPQNIMLVGALDQPRVVLLDFGIARIEGTDTTSLIATPHYLAPERALGAAPTASSDLYALGIVLFHALTGSPPFDAPNLHAIIELHRTMPLPPLKLANGSATGMEAGLEAIIRKLATKEPAQRYASAAAVRHDLLLLNDGSIHSQATQAVASTPRVVPRPLPASTGPAIATSSHKAIGLRYLAIPLLLGLLLLGAMMVRGGVTAGPLPETPERTASVAPVSQSAPPPAPAQDAVVVPNVVGLPAEAAQAQLQNVGLQGVVEAPVVSEQPAGTVISMAPGAGQSVPPGSAVLLQISGDPTPNVAQPNTEDNNAAQDDDKDDDKKGKGKGKGKGKQDD